MYYVYSSFSIKAPNKDRNEDCVSGEIRLPKDRGAAFAIADGVGGHAGGQEASSTAIRKVTEYLELNEIVNMTDCFRLIANSIKESSSNHAELKHMATTLSVCILRSNKAEIAHVGDTRIYHIRNQGIMLRTNDQTEVQELIQQGVLTKEKAKHYPRKNVLLSALSAKIDYKLYMNEFDVLAGDRIVLVSDGLYNRATAIEIRDLSVANSDLKEFAKALVAFVESRVPDDDCSGICVEIKSAI